MLCKKIGLKPYTVNRAINQTGWLWDGKGRIMGDYKDIKIIIKNYLKYLK